MPWPLAICLLAVGCADSVAHSPASRVDPSRARALIDQSVQAGDITRRTCLGNEAAVRPGFWQGLNERGKQGVVLSLAAICLSEGSGDRMTVYDAQSGKRLAAYTGSRVTFD
jgi:hypothetical protein